MFNAINSQATHAYAGPATHQKVRDEHDDEYDAEETLQRCRRKVIVEGNRRQKELLAFLARRASSTDKTTAAIARAIKAEGDWLATQKRPWGAAEDTWAPPVEQAREDREPTPKRPCHDSARYNLAPPLWVRHNQEPHESAVSSAGGLPSSQTAGQAPAPEASAAGTEEAPAGTSTAPAPKRKPGREPTNAVERLAHEIKCYLNFVTDHDPSDHQSLADVQLTGAGAIETAELVWTNSKTAQAQAPTAPIGAAGDGLHAKELALAAALGVGNDKYKCQKRRILLGAAIFRTVAAREGLSAVFKTTHSQQVVNADVSKMAVFFTNFVNWGWMDLLDTRSASALIGEFEAVRAAGESWKEKAEEQKKTLDKSPKPSKS